MPENTGPEQASRDAGSRFQKGQSGNPAGKPRGSRNRATVAIEEMLQGEGEAITRKAIELAKQGDTVALRLVMERVAPVRKGRPVRFSLPEVEQAGDVSKALGSVLKAAAQGELTPDEAVTFASVLEAKRKAIETVEFEARLVALEKASAADGGRRR